MRLIKCYVENFGTLSRKEIGFNSGINCFLSENGSGKTTLGMFIMSMLYGIGDTRKSSLDENERKKYMPWQGGRFGGSLTFEARGKVYTVERSFGQKANLDTFNLIYANTGAKSGDFSENLGEELFEIDRDGFLRTVFLSEKGLGSGNDNKSISAKLSDLVDVDGDVGEYDEAQELLEKARMQYYKRGGGGEISDLKAKISSIDDELMALEGLRGEATEKKLHLSELAAGIGGLEKERDLLGFTLTRISQNRDEIAKNNALFERIKALEKRLTREEESFAEISSFFKSGVPSLSELDRYGDDYRDANKLFEESQRHTESPELKELELFFTKSVSKEEIRDALKKTEELEYLEKNGGAAPKPENKGKKEKRLLFPLSLLLIALGVGLAFIYLPLLLLSLAGLVILISALVKKNATSTENVTENRCERREKLTRALESFLNGFTGMKGLGYKEAVTTIKEKHLTYEILLKQRENEEAERLSKRERAQLILKNTENFLRGFGALGERPFDTIRAKKAEYDIKEAEIKRLKTELKDLKEKLSVNYGGLGSEYQEDESEVLKRYNVISDRISELNKKHGLIHREYTALLEKLDRTDELKTLKDGYSERLSECERNLEIIKKTKSLLEEAYNSMNSRYVEKTKRGFLEIIKSVGLEDGDYAMDADFTITKNERGGARSEECFSRGTKDLYALAVRLSLTEALYGDEKPFLILDDPLLSLDDKKRERAKTLLKNYGKTRQLIYFTCAKERAL